MVPKFGLKSVDLIDAQVWLKVQILFAFYEVYEKEFYGDTFESLFLKFKLLLSPF
jgi:hypothetical protein